MDLLAHNSRAPTHYATLIHEKQADVAHTFNVGINRKMNIQRPLATDVASL